MSVSVDQNVLGVAPLENAVMDGLKVDAKDVNGRKFENEIAQIEKDPEVILVKDIFEKKYKDFIGAAKISRRDYPMLSHSYFVIRELKEGEVELTVQQQFHKKLFEDGFLNEGSVKYVYKLKSPETGEISGVRAVLKQGRSITPQAIEAIGEFIDDPDICGGYYLTYTNKESGKLLHVFLHPYMNGGDLVAFFSNMKEINESLKMKIMLQVCRGLKKMHDSGWLHMDIKPDNILVHKDPLKIKLADLDSAEKPSESSRLSMFGTPLYIAPEIMKEDIFGLEAGKKCDIYSLGMTFWYISELEDPTFNLNKNGELDPPKSYFDLVIQRGFPVSDKQTPMQRLIFKMINPTAPEERPNINKVISKLKSLP